jgi:hypothetical protein
VRDATYYVQFEAPEEPGRWHTIARVHDHELADAIARLAERSYGRTAVLTHFRGRVVSRSALRRQGTLAHADWELGIGRYREYAELLRQRAERDAEPG